MEASEDWKEDCLKFYGEILTGTNAHWCPDWDFLPIDDTCEEMKYCTCDKTNLNKPNDSDKKNGKDNVSGNARSAT